MAKVLCTILFALLIAVRVEGAPITVSAGETVLFNFDLTTADPPPPYDGVGFLTEIVVESITLGAQGTWTMYSDLDATGAVFFIGAHHLTAVFSHPEMIDGLFSARLTMTQGSIIIDPSALGWVGFDFTEFVPGTLVTTVPEPASLALLGMGAVFMGGRAWRRRRSR